MTVITNQSFLKKCDKLKIWETNKLCGNKTVTWEQLINILSKLKLYVRPRPSDKVRIILYGTYMSKKKGSTRLSYSRKSWKRYIHTGLYK